MRLGARVVLGQCQVHVSGHASPRRSCSTSTTSSPATLCPSTAKSRHLVANGELAVHQDGFLPEQVMPVRGRGCRRRGQKVAHLQPSPCGYNVDGSWWGDRRGQTQDRRTHLGGGGFVSVYAVVETMTGTILAGPHIQARGVAGTTPVFENSLITHRRCHHARGSEGERLPPTMRHPGEAWVSTACQQRASLSGVIGLRMLSLHVCSRPAYFTITDPSPSIPFKTSRICRLSGERHRASSGGCR